MSKMPPDQILDVRVTVPAGWHVNKVTATQDYPPGSDNPLWLCAIEAINPAIDRRPLFPGAIDDPIVDPHCVLQGQMDKQAKLIRRLVDHLGLMIGDYGRIYAKPEPKPTIKGGSVNVYRDCGGSIYFGTLDGRKHDVDELVACIQIPDITEGEGL